MLAPWGSLGNASIAPQMTLVAGCKPLVPVWWLSLEDEGQVSRQGRYQDGAGGLRGRAQECVRVPGEPAPAFGAVCPLAGLTSNREALV